MSTNNGGPAFPYDDSPYVKKGMTLRDYFAAKAIPMATEMELKFPTGSDGFEPSYQGIARRAYYLADALIAARGDV